MNWNDLLTTCRLGIEYNEKHDGRSEFQRDYDRLVFSAPFRRLQNKTQVFPLPGSIFVHNRLTHSLEVSCVGRSIGNLVYHLLQKKYQDSVAYLSEIGSIVAAACLAHDMGNPPFGHSGENAIATYFSEGAGEPFLKNLSDAERKDIVQFEGNANAFRLLTAQFNGRRNGGFALTYTTLASIIKYPYEAQFADEKKTKFGFFQTEKDIYSKIANTLGLIPNPKNRNRYARHPLVYIVEVADDICYQIMDIEDAFKLKILSYEETVGVLLDFLSEERKKRALETFSIVEDVNEQIAYLRSSVMGSLIDASANVFVENEEQILSGMFEKSLINNLPEPLKSAYEKASRLSVDKIYRSQLVLDVELAGYRVISKLIDVLINAVFNPEKTYSKQILNRIPLQYNVHSDTTYGKIQAVLDYISGMTDVYALDLYRKINGMSLPAL
ncbi:MAG: deoxyguanosinetriphosphate triphosphohydrolase [Paludibacteraceae bacterium]|nr:deoxyguanosinetriphosphate triphosphohydrolase [Paludibacteraceae bacterium]